MDLFAEIRCIYDDINFKNNCIQKILFKSFFIVKKNDAMNINYKSDTMKS